MPTTLTDSQCQFDEKLTLPPESHKIVVEALMTAENGLNDGEDTSRTEDHLQVIAALRHLGYRLIEHHGKRGWLPLNLWLVAIDEMDHWNVPAKYKRHIQRVEAVFLYDSNAYTHLCEFTPSYDLIYVDTQVVFTKGTSDAMRDQIDNWMRDGLVDQADHEYAHVSEIDAFPVAEANHPSNPVVNRRVHYGNPGFSFDDAEGDDDAAKEQEILAAVLEHVRGNSMI